MYTRLVSTFFSHMLSTERLFNIETFGLDDFRNIGNTLVEKCQEISLKRRLIIIKCYRERDPVMQFSQRDQKFRVYL